MTEIESSVPLSEAELTHIAGNECREFDPLEDWLVEKISLDEAKQMAGSLRFAPGYAAGGWDVLEKIRLPTDELWVYCSPSAYWESMAGREGVVLVRSGSAIYAIVTAMN